MYLIMNKILFKPITFIHVTIIVMTERLHVHTRLLSNTAVPTEYETMSSSEETSNSSVYSSPSGVYLSFVNF